jgi:type VI secretion system protein ImpH
LGFNPGEIEGVEVHGEPPESVTVTASMFGLCGSSTPLPLYLAEEADEDDGQGAAIRGLLDVFHHRLFTLLFRGLRGVDLPATLHPEGDDAWTRRVLEFLGVEAAPSSTIPQTTLLRLAPVLAAGVRSPSMLEAALHIVLEDQLGSASLRVEPLSGEWTAIDRSQWTRLGSVTARLGESFVAGTEVEHPAGAADIVIGPLSGEHHKVFTPGGVGYARVRDLSEGFVPEPIAYNLVLEIQDMTYPPAILGRRSLGTDFWLAHSEHSGVATRKVVPVE